MTSAAQPQAITPVARLQAGRRLLDAALLAGLSGVFLVNAIVAALQPSDFTGLVERSLLGRLLPVFTGDWMAWAIGITDCALGVGLVVPIWSRRARPVPLAWAGVWLFAVTIIKVTSLHALGG